MGKYDQFFEDKKNHRRKYSDRNFFSNFFKKKLLQDSHLKYELEGKRISYTESFADSAIFDFISLSLSSMVMFPL